MEEILHHLGVETLYINTGINHLSTGAGFLPSTVISHHGLVALASPAMPPLRGFPTMFFFGPPGSRRAGAGQEDDVGN